MDTSTVVFITGIISCVIGVASFVTGIATRARNDGKLESKLEFCMKGIEEIKRSVVNIENKQGTHDTTLARLDSELKSLRKTHESEISRVEQEISELKERLENHVK